jgi:hypothetical protein
MTTRHDDKRSLQQKKNLYVRHSSVRIVVLPIAEAAFQKTSDTGRLALKKGSWNVER